MINEKILTVPRRTNQQTLVPLRSGGRQYQYSNMNDVFYRWA